MRQLLGYKKVRRLAQQTGLDIVRVYVRGGTNHRKDIITRDGREFSLYNDGALKETNAN